MLGLAWISTARLSIENYHAYNCLISVPSTLTFRFHSAITIPILSISISLSLSISISVSIYLSVSLSLPTSATTVHHTAIRPSNARARITLSRSWNWSWNAVRARVIRARSTESATTACEIQSWILLLRLITFMWRLWLFPDSVRGPTNHYTRAPPILHLSLLSLFSLFHPFFHFHPPLPFVFLSLFLSLFRLLLSLWRGFFCFSFHLFFLFHPPLPHTVLHTNTHTRARGYLTSSCVSSHALAFFLFTSRR